MHRALGRVYIQFLWGIEVSGEGLGVCRQEEAEPCESCTVDLQHLSQSIVAHSERRGIDNGVGVVASHFFTFSHWALMLKSIMVPRAADARDRRRASTRR